MMNPRAGPLRTVKKSMQPMPSLDASMPHRLPVAQQAGMVMPTTETIGQSGSAAGGGIAAPAAESRRSSRGRIDAAGRGRHQARDAHAPAALMHMFAPHGTGIPVEVMPPVPPVMPPVPVVPPVPVCRRCRRRCRRPEAARIGVIVIATTAACDRHRAASRTHSSTTSISSSHPSSPESQAQADIQAPPFAPAHSARTRGRNETAFVAARAKSLYAVRRLHGNCGDAARSHGKTTEILAWTLFAVN